MRFDLVINGGRLIDPESSRDDFFNVGVKNGKISAISTDLLMGVKEIDATGYVVAPGFIDIHTHEDAHDSLPVETASTFLRSGVTTIVGGNCGGSPFPIGSYLASAKQAAPPLPINYVMLVGYNSLRQELGIHRYRAASEAELVKLCEMAVSGLEQGAVGISLGLEYAPGIAFAEASKMAQIVAEHDAFLAVHMRYDYPRRAIEAMEEMRRLAVNTGAKIEISHIAANVYGVHKGIRNIHAGLSLLEDWHRQGLRIKADTYPYNVWGAGVKSTVFDPEFFNELTFAYEDVEVLKGPLAGKRLTEELFIELRQQEQDTSVACHNAMPIEDVKEALKHPYVCVGSDGSMARDSLTGDLEGHPRCAGTIGKFLGMVREEELMELVTAIRKLTLDPALMINLPSKGRLQIGKDADITVFDFDKIKDQSEFGSNVCALPPRGIPYVIVGGKLVNTEQDSLDFERRLRNAP